MYGFYLVNYAGHWKHTHWRKNTLIFFNLSLQSFFEVWRSYTLPAEGATGPALGRFARAARHENLKTMLANCWGQDTNLADTQPKQKWLIILLPRTLAGGGGGATAVKEPQIRKTHLLLFLAVDYLALPQTRWFKKKNLTRLIRKIPLIFFFILLMLGLEVNKHTQ